LEHTPPTLTGVCGSDPGISCRLVWDLSHNVRAAQLTGIYLSGPIHLILRLAFVVILALLIRGILHRLINRITERAAETLLPQFRNPLPGGRLVPAALVAVRLRRRRKARPAATAEAGAGSPAAGNAAASETVTEETLAVQVAIVAERRHQRVHALGQVLRSAASVTIFGIAGVVILGDLGITLGPLLASAGVVGVAIGFGAQNLVRDYLTGIFMLLEDQYGVGDVISVGRVTGTVETMTLRITRLRDVNGIVWHIRNGAIERVGNQSQGWARAVVDFPVPYTADLGTIRAILGDVADGAWNDPALRAFMLEKPEVWGAQDVSSTEVIMRLVARTAPLRQWETEREMRARVKAALDAAGISPAPAPDAGR
jgi:small-conductance mechanosensitive channel